MAASSTLPGARPQPARRIAIIGGGIAGLAAAYELELAHKRGASLDWHLYEATGRLGGIVQTTRRETDEGEWILEGGPDAWVTEKPWARDLAIELGLERDLIESNDATKKTYILLPDDAGCSQLVAMPQRMRMMVPEDLAALDDSPLFSAEAKQAYANEFARAAELQAASPFADAEYDESVAAFVLRHFGEEVLTKVAGPLLSGVFGGDVHKLSVRAVMPAFVPMEQQHGSLIAAQQARKAARGNQPVQPTFTSLRRGMGSLVEALVATLPPERLHSNTPVHELEFEDQEWTLGFVTSDALTLRQRLSASTLSEPFEDLILATSLDATRELLRELDPVQTTLLPSSGSFLSLAPTDASSAVLATFCWTGEAARTFPIPPGFGFLVPDTPKALYRGRHPEQREGSPHSLPSGTYLSTDQATPQLLAVTFTDQKFPNRAPAGARAIRAFFGGDSASTLLSATDDAITDLALANLRDILGSLPQPAFTTVSRWPRSLPQYEVGHNHRIAELDRLVAQFDGTLTLLGNSYRGVGVPDLIRDARSAVRNLLSAS